MEVTCRVMEPEFYQTIYKEVVKNAQEWAVRELRQGGPKWFGLTPNLRACSYKVRLNSAVASVIIRNADTVRYSRSMRIATNPASFNSNALNPCTE
jgi:hypothetical protein